MGKKQEAALLEVLELEFAEEKGAIDDDPWREDPLPLQEFVESSLHLSSGQRISLFPAQLEDLQAFLGATAEDAKSLFSQSPPTAYNCAVLAYGKSSGKGYMVSICLAWLLYVLLCLKDPQKFLGLAPAEPIDIALCSPTLRQTRRITFQKFKNRLFSWRWFRDRLAADGIDPDRFLKNKIGADFIEFPGGIRIHNLPLDTTAAEGFNMLAFCIDELAGMTSEANSESASALLNTFITSARSRFKKAWKGWVIGFPRSVNDPQEQIIADADAGKFPDLLVRRRATWEVNVNLSEEDFASDFLRNPEDSEAKFRAVPMAASQSFFRSPELIIKNAIGGDLELLTKAHPSLSPDQLAQYAEYMSDPIVERDAMGDIVLTEYGFPRLHPWFRGRKDKEGDDIEFYLHIDVGLSRDSTGIAIAHLDRSEFGVQPVLDLAFRWKASHFAKFGIIKRWNWGEGANFTESVEASEIDLQTVIDFVIWLKRARGFAIAQVTSDGFNSAQLLQRLRQHDIPTGLHIANKADYDELKGHIYSRTLRYRCDRIFYYELIKLVILNGTKVEAPRTKLGNSSGADSHKELADAAAVVVGQLSRLVEDTTTYIEVEIPASIWDKPEMQDKEGVRVEMERSAFDALQQEIFQQFLDG